LKPPRLIGPALSAIRAAAETGPTAALLKGVLSESLGLDKLRAVPHFQRLALPMSNEPVVARAERSLPDAGLGSLPRASGADAWPRTSADLRAAYQGGRSAADVATRSLAFVRRLEANRVHNVVAAESESRTREEGEASERRWRSGAPLGPLDGVPFLVKDELDVEGLATRVGSRCEPTDPAPRDSTVVQRLKRAGAVFAAKTVMTEWGMSPLGQNPHFNMPVNAHHAERLPGGSSSGTAVGVALGVAPLGIGTDGGGSVRIPAALNGLFGIKPTFGRVSRFGSLSGSVGHIGPIATSTAELAHFLDAVSSTPDPLDATTAWARKPPKGGFGARLGAGVKGLRVGVPEAELSVASPEVAASCRAALVALEREGATLVSVSLPLAAVAAPIGYLTIGCEVVATHWHHFVDRRDLMGEDLRLSFAILASVPAHEFLDAQRLRAALRAETAKVLTEVDVLALPTTATTAPKLPVEQRGRPMSDPEAIDAMCRFNFLGNLTGLPAGTAPIGLDPDGLPIGLQIVGDAWDEAVVLGVLAHLERASIAKVPRAKAAMDLLG
jgi:aspartyl-tRNA(Asn)/glutamyl-tRNA(Gln) amidotransferase subunit A